jgi:hypothetical protein
VGRGAVLARLGLAAQGSRDESVSQAQSRADAPPRTLAVSARGALTARRGSGILSPPGQMVQTCHRAARVLYQRSRHTMIPTHGI